MRNVPDVFMVPTTPTDDETTSSDVIFVFVYSIPVFIAPTEPHNDENTQSSN